jgi:adenine deaminase
MEGVEFMIENGKTVPFKFNFGAPSCVPATIFETAGATLDSTDVEKLLKRDEIKYLSEMMNFPGVLNEDEEVMKKIAAAHRLLKPVDGHAPGLRGDLVKQYISAGITTDHECFTKEEALDKLQNGMKILIREGSAAKNFEALIDLLNDYPNQMMFCSDDKHPDSLVFGHINQLCERAVAKGINVYKVLTAACVNPVLHYKLDVGLLKEGDAADLIVVKDLEKFEVVKTYINGELVAEEGKSKIESGKSKVINNFSCSKKKVEDFQYLLNKYGEEENIEQVNVIEALDGQLITNKLIRNLKDVFVKNGFIESNPENDILKIVVVNRYTDSPIAKAFIKNFGLKKGAIASSVAHDSHNIVAVGVDDENICKAVNLVIEQQGGISAVDNEKEMVLALSVAGLMSNDGGYKVAAAYTAIDKVVKEKLGSTLSAPFMTLSFMALLVIPHLKLSDKGLFDGDSFSFV